MTKPETLQAVSKAQWIRLVDVYFLGPFMIFLAFNEKKMCPYRRSILGFFGATTIWYNWKNYRENQERLQTMSGVYNNPSLNDDVFVDGQTPYMKLGNQFSKKDIELLKKERNRAYQKKLFYDVSLDAGQPLKVPKSKNDWKKVEEAWTNHLMSKWGYDYKEANIEAKKKTNWSKGNAKRRNTFSYPKGLRHERARL